MSSQSKAKLRESAEIFKALAHPSRLTIIEALSRGKHCVNELTELVGSDMSTVSRHLAQLRNVGLIRDEKQGLQVFYELRCHCVLKFLDCVESVAAERDETACDCR
ncbi:MAG: metalloregulator ArsR/SmtB family transcription factor [Planctomycetaceae bacterium]|nr:metalloregulator ArsR/SmtB family transcription factor [Planctomycetaceae bacterium]